MGWKCAPQVMGLVRGEPKQGQKHRANIRKIAMEAGYERASRSDTLDRSRSSQNQYDGYWSGATFADAMEQEAAEYRVKVNGKTKDGQPVVREKGLPHNAVIGWAVIYNPPAEVCADWTDEEYRKFHRDCRECMAEIEPRLFRSENIRMSAEHFDEGVPPESGSGKIDRHFHDLGVSKDGDGHYCGNLIDAKLLIRINERFPAMMRERGWDMDDLDRTDFERAKTDKEYASERNAKRRKSGLSVNKHLSKKAQKLVDDAAEMADQAAEIKQQSEAEAAARKQQLDEIARKQNSRSKGQRRVLGYFRTMIEELGDDPPERFKTYEEIVDTLRAAKQGFVDKAREDAQEEAAAEYQEKMEALEAQQAALADQQDKMNSLFLQVKEIRDALSRSADQDTSRKRFMEAHRANGRTLEEIYQADIAKKQAQYRAFFQRGQELSDEYDAARMGALSDPQKV